ncbi:MAG: homoserine O-acetyltransferase [Pirellulales bacterium]|nr:homoserine O-acetyltransferase [Pirellulales bacterium]
MPDLFDSSDSIRSGKPLKYARSVTFSEPLHLERGGRLPQVTVAFETYGRLNARRDNAVLICHALSGDSHVARHDDADDPGWWDILIGPGKGIDTDRYFVICPNSLGGCRGSTGPNGINPETGRRYGTDFPVITVGDIVETQRRLLDQLGIERLRAVVGGSLGGHTALAWATRHPGRVAGAVALATSPRLTSQALAFDVVGRNAILSDPEYKGGDFYEQGQGPVVGLAIARMLGHITYLSREAMTQKFDAERFQPRSVQTQFETKFSVGSYLAYQGDRFGERFDPNSYLTLTMAIDLFDLGDTKEQLAAAFRASQCRWLMMSFTSDWLFPPFQTQEMVDALLAEGKPVSSCNIATDCGHDAFLLPNQVHLYGEMIRAFLANLEDEPGAAGILPVQSQDHTGATGILPVQSSSTGNMPVAPDEPSAVAPDEPSAGINPAARFEETAAASASNIFHHHRLDYETILGLIPADSSILDLGCGSGELLARLRERGHRRIIGVELDEQAILACMRRGLDVVQADLNRGLPAFTDGQFDFVVLSQTLQTVLDVPRVLGDMLRVGRRAIVSFPNFAYKKHRRQLAEEGRTPRSLALNFPWYDTPNVRFLSIVDFEEFCGKFGFHILEQIALDTEADVQVFDDPNLNADVAIAVLGR